MHNSQVLIVNEAGVCMLPAMAIVVKAVPRVRRFSGDRRAVRLLKAPEKLKQLPLLIK